MDNTGSRNQNIYTDRLVVSRYALKPLDMNALRDWLARGVLRFTSICSAQVQVRIMSL